MQPHMVSCGTKALARFRIANQLTLFLKKFDQRGSATLECHQFLSPGIYINRLKDRKSKPYRQISKQNLSQEYFKQILRIKEYE